MKQYQKLISEILTNGIERNDRTGTKTLSIFGHQSKYNLQNGFPLVTTKKTYFKGVVEELRWFLSGSTNFKDLDPSIYSWWSPWARSDGELGKIYGYQLRKYNGHIDQLQNVIDSIKSDPSSRRHVINLWNAGDLDDQQLACCHGSIIQFYVANNRLSCHMYQRSADAFLGVPVNIASYALLTHMVAQVCDLKVGSLVHSFGDVHIYLTHIEQCKEILKREPKLLPRIELDANIKDINDFTFDSFKLINYFPHDKISGKLAI